jgi:hypothetical protein
MSRPQSGVVWLRRSATTRTILQDLAHGRIPCSHAGLDAAGADRAVEYLRCLLVRYGVLPTRDRRLADFQRWAAAKLDGIGNAEHRQLLERFLRWYLLRRLTEPLAGTMGLIQGVDDQQGRRVPLGEEHPRAVLTREPPRSPIWPSALDTTASRMSPPAPNRREQVV